MYKIILLFFVSITLYGCKDQNSDFKIGQGAAYYKTIEEYLVDYQTDNLDREINSPVYFVFANNPYLINKESYLTISINHQIVYSGAFKKKVLLDKELISKTKTIRISFDILLPYDDGYSLHKFGNKSTYSWEDNLPFIYACFFPLNQNIDRVHFFPSKDNIFHLSGLAPQ